MFPHQFYLVLHLFGMAMIIYALGYALAGAHFGIPKEQLKKKALVKIYMFGLLVLFVAGFGLIAKLSLPFPWPVWVWLKFCVWLFFGLVLTLVLKNPKQATLWAVISAVLFLFVAYLGVYKP